MTGDAAAPTTMQGLARSPASTTGTARAEALEHLVTVRDLIRHAVTRMHTAQVAFGHGLPDALAEADTLVRWALGVPYGDAGAMLLDARTLPSERHRVLDLIDRRCDARVPLPYLTGEAWLGTLRFVVDPRVLIPRSYLAELLPDALAPWLPEPDAVGAVLDLCTGSGCLAIVAAYAYPEAHVVASDLSPEALEVARKNIALHAMQTRVTPVRADLFDALDARRFDLIVSNPPYVTAASMAALPPEYRHEPALALAAGDDGLDLVRRLLAQAARHLIPDGVLLVECGHARERVEAAFPRLPFTWLETVGGDDAVFLLTRADLDPPSRHSR